MKKNKWNSKIENTGILLRFICINGKVEEILESAIDSSILAVYGSFIVPKSYPTIKKSNSKYKQSDTIKRNKLLVEISKDIDIEVTDTDESEKILYQNTKDLPESRNPFLFYGLTIDYEFLTYVSLDKIHKFCLKCRLNDSFNAKEIRNEIKKLEYYKAYTEFKNLVNLTLPSYLMTYTFSFEPYKNVTQP